MQNTRQTGVPILVAVPLRATEQRPKCGDEQKSFVRHQIVATHCSQNTHIHSEWRLDSLQFPAAGFRGVAQVWHLANGKLSPLDYLSDLCQISARQIGVSGRRFRPNKSTLAELINPTQGSIFP